MAPRYLTWHDWPLLSRYRERALCLDSRRLCAGGRGLMGGGLLSYLGPATGVYTALERLDGVAYLGQMEIAPQAAVARLTYLAPDEALHAQAPVSGLLAYLAGRAVAHGARYLVAEVPAEAPFLSALHAAGLTPEMTLRLWRWEADGGGEEATPGRWQAADEVTRWEAGRWLHRALSPLARRVWPTEAEVGGVWVYRCGREVWGAALVARGPQGTWAQVALPEGEAGLTALRALVTQLGSSSAMPLFFCAPERDGITAQVLQQGGAVPGPRWVLMVRPLAVTARMPEAVAWRLARWTRLPLLPHTFAIDPLPPGEEEEALMPVGRVRFQGDVENDRFSAFSGV